MSLESAASKYFSEMNSIAARMWVDMNETKIAYEELWKTLPEEEQKQILSETIIKPEILIKYNNQRDEDDIKEYAMKFIIDDNNCSYRDEHSGPFSFKTQSQRDLLSLFCKRSIHKKTNNKLNVAQNRPLPKPKHNKPKCISEDCVDDGNATELNNMSDTNSNSSTVPKTGLDFLDNW